MMNKIFLAVVIILSALHSYGQKKIKLTNATSHRVITITEGKKVIYTIRNVGTRTGILDRIENDFIEVNGKTVAVQDLLEIGRRRSRFGQIFCLAVGGVLVLAAVTPNPTPQCQGCQQVGSDDNTPLIEGAALGVAFITLGATYGARNKPKDIVERWKMEIVD